MIQAPCAECGRPIIARPGKVQEAVKDHKERCRAMQALGEAAKKGYRAFDERHPLPQGRVGP
jgi:hypothetical protein